MEHGQAPAGLAAQAQGDHVAAALPDNCVIIMTDMEEAMGFAYGEVIEVQPEGKHSEIRQKNAFTRREIVANFCVGKKPPLVTICFQAYNHLEDQTKLAIRAIL